MFTSYFRLLYRNVMSTTSQSQFSNSALSQSGLRIAPADSGFLLRARAGLDDLGQPVERHVAKGGEPLRDCLRRARPGEAVLLGSYCPFKLAGPFKEYGPIYISANEQDPPNLRMLPVDGEGPYLGVGFVLRAYSRDERIVNARLSSPQAAADDLAAFFASGDVAFVLGRFSTYGCYALRLERA
jgi:hypothetical protein